MIIHTGIRRGAAMCLGRSAYDLWRSLGDNQPLLLHREPGNKQDPNAVRTTDLFGNSCGYLFREDAQIISPMLQSRSLLARCDGPREARQRPVLVWEDGGSLLLEATNDERSKEEA